MYLFFELFFFEKMLKTKYFRVARMSHHSYVGITVIRIFRMLSDISSICYDEADHLGKYF